MHAVLNLVGIAVILGIVWLCSYNRKKVNWKLIGKAMLAQLILAIIVIKVPAGVWLIENISNAVTVIINFGKAGLEFVFGAFMNIEKTGFVFIIHVLGNIVFIGALVSLLTYCGILGFVIDKLGKFVGKVLGASKLECFISVANMFLGQTESPLFVSKYIKFMTNGEIIVVLVAGMGSMSVSILGGYSAMGVPMPFLITACALVPFGSIAIGKLMMPDEESNDFAGDVKVDRKSAGANVVDAISNGAMDGMKMVIAIAASLIAFNGLIALVNGGLANFGLRLEQILGIIFYPISFLMGLDGNLTQLGGEILGLKLVLNEFIAYGELMKYIGGLDYRTAAILCVTIGGFANLGSMAVCVSGLGALCPEKKSLISKLIVRALVGAFCLNIMNGMIVGLILSF